MGGTCSSHEESENLELKFGQKILGEMATLENLCRCISKQQDLMSRIELICLSFEPSNDF